MKKVVACSVAFLVFCAFIVADETKKSGRREIVGSVDLSLVQQQPPVVEQLPPVVETPKTYKVKKNDNLWTISVAVYGVGYKWEIIYQANENKIKNPNILRVGQVLTIPDRNTKLKKRRRKNDTGIHVPPGYEYVKTVRAHCTGYCGCPKCCGTHANGITSIGDSAHILNGVAADPRAIPYRWLVYIPGKGFREVDDTGGAMRRSWRRGIYHIDVRFATHSQAMKYNKWLDIKIFRKKSQSSRSRMAMK